MAATPLKDYRIEARLTQIELGESSGVDVSYISMLETGAKKNVSMRVAWRLSRALNATGRFSTPVTPADLFPETVFGDVVLAHASSHATSTA